MGRSNISISLDGYIHKGTGDFPTYVPGQRVSGKVHFLLQAQKDIESIVIEFEGKCYTRVKRTNGNNTTYHSETIDLFRFSQTLFRGPYTMQPISKEWPFSFTIPESSSFSRDHSGRDSIIYDSKPQRLPPSLDIHPASGKSIKAMVYYHLTAKINPNAFMGKKETVLPIVLVPFSKTPPSEPSKVPIWINQQVYRSSSLRPEKHSFKQKMSHVFWSDPSLKTPCVNFAPKAYLPTSASIWQPLPIEISIQHVPTGPTDPEKPTLILDAVTLQLKQYTVVRVKSTFGNYGDDMGKSMLATHTIRAGTILPLDGHQIEISNTFRLADMLKEVYRLAPSFFTYTINQSYSLKMIATVRHEESGHRYNFDAKTKFTILPMYDPNPSRPELVVTSPTTVASPSEDSPAYTFDNIELPAYEGPSSSSSVWQAAPDAYPHDVKQDSIAVSPEGSKV